MPDDHLSASNLRTPAAAAVAGILFAVLYGTSYFMILGALPTVEYDRGGWLTRSESTIANAMVLMPFSGIAFLWFMGVIRDRLGHLEDQFFSTLFLGAGILYVSSLFITSAIAGGVLALPDPVQAQILDNGVYLTLRSIAHQIANIYGIRMAGMFMFVLGTIWARTRAMPRWLVAITWILALVLLFGMSYSQWAIMIFPSWVLLISVFILLMNLRAHRQQRSDGPDDA